MRSAGTTLWLLDPSNGCTALQIGCPTAISGLDSTVDQLETTCLDSLARTYEAGLATPGTASFTLTLDPNDISHVRLLQLKGGANVQWAIGFPESNAEPGGGVGSDGECYWDDLPTSRTWVTFEGFVNSYAFDFPLNGLITATVGVQVSGDPEMIPKAA